MNKQTHSEETLKRTKGIIGDEDKHKSSTENPEKELIEYIYKIHTDLDNYICNLIDLYFYISKILEPYIDKQYQNYINNKKI